IADDGRRTRTRHEPLGDVAGAPGDVEEELARTRVEAADQFRLPQPVDAATHEVVHQVVAGRHRREDAAYTARLFLERYALEAEIRLAACLGGRHDGTIAPRSDRRYRARPVRD